MLVYTVVQSRRPGVEACVIPKEEIVAKGAINTWFECTLHTHSDKLRSLIAAATACLYIEAFESNTMITARCRRWLRDT